MTTPKKIAIASIQRNRNKYIIEWIAFHLAVGFNQFYIYCHKTDDGMTETLLRMSEKYPIEVFTMEMNDFPQLIAYQHAYANYGSSVDWMAFIDGDEFLFTTESENISQALSLFDNAPISALGAFWKCYGSNGHILDPEGLVIENYPLHSGDDFLVNRHIKSIVKGGGNIIPIRSHLFETQNGTFDENMRFINHGWMKELEPTYKYLRINHYVHQSKEFSFCTKINSGMADLIGGLSREKNGKEKALEEFEKNDELMNLYNDHSIDKFIIPTRDKAIEICEYLGYPLPQPPLPPFGIMDIIGMAEDFEKNGEPQKAIDLYSTWLKVKNTPEDWPINFNLASLYYHNDNLKKAFEQIALARQKQPQLPIIINAYNLINDTINNSIQRFIWNGHPPVQHLNKKR